MFLLPAFRRQALRFGRQLLLLVAGGSLLWLMQLLFIQSDYDRQAKKTLHMSEHAVLVSPPIPERIEFAGERVPLQYFDVREDLEKHLLINTYHRPATVLILKRAARWKGRMQAILRKHGVPEDFFYLMVAESGVRNATSRASAQGYWQFMEATARQYGLEVNEYVDQRNDPVAATHAAARYLTKAHERFGNWTIAAASYNMGMGGVNGSMRRQEITSFFDLYLNPETANYIYRILSYKLILEHPERYGYKIYPGDLYEPVPSSEITIQGPVEDLRAFARAQGTTYKLLRRMNPWLERSRLPNPKHKPYTLRIVKDDHRQMTLAEPPPGLPGPHQQPAYPPFMPPDSSARTATD